MSFYTGETDTAFYSFRVQQHMVLLVTTKPSFVLVQPTEW
jgi:hypothetical protein